MYFYIQGRTCHKKISLSLRDSTVFCEGKEGHFTVRFRKPNRTAPWGLAKEKYAPRRTG